MGERLKELGICNWEFVIRCGSSPFPDLPDRQALDRGWGEVNHTSSHLTSDIEFMLTVHLSNLRFFAHHGAYEGEPETGGGFEVHLQVGYEEKKIKFNDLKNVLNYEELYHIVKKRMMMPTPLLEEVAESIIRKIRHEYSFVKEVSISIFKLQAPIEHFEGKVGITLQKKFDD